MEAINPYINFNGKCSTAMKFYHESFGGELELNAVKGSPMEKDWQGSVNDIFHSSLIINGKQVLMGSDMTDQLGYVKGTDIALALTCISEDEIYSLFDKLSIGGNVLSPLKEQSWGAIFGSVQDQFGVKWMLNYNK